MTIHVTKLHYHQQQKLLDIYFSNGEIAHLSAELLRTHSPSAEVQGHSAKQAKLVTNKKQVQISDITAIGHYAIKLTFDDGHNSGLFSWQYLYELSINKIALWEKYLAQLSKHNAGREAIIPIKVN